MVGDQHADALGCEFRDDALNIYDRKRVDARKRFIEEYKTGLGSEGTRYFDASTLTD